MIHTSSTIGFVLAMALAVGGCESNLPPDVAKCSYVNPTYRFAMNLPAGWSVRESPGSSAILALGPAGKDGVRPSIEVAIEPYDPMMDLDVNVGYHLEGLSKMQGFRLVASEGAPASPHRQTFALTFKHSALGVPLVQRQLYERVDDRLYVTTATTSEANDEADGPVLEAAIASIRVGW